MGREKYKLGIIGSGIMGSGIAITCALAGHRVYLNDISEEILNKSKSYITHILEYLHNIKWISIDPNEVLDNILFSLDVNNVVSNSKFVFEAATEKLDVKKKIFMQLKKYISNETILASNTSVIKIENISEDIDIRDRIIGVHWMNPPFILPLVELVHSQHTSEKVIRETRIFLEKELGKIVIESPDIPGFIVNRFAAAISSEAVRLVDEGVSIEDIDKVWKDHLGILYMLFGPFGNLDQIGLDTVYLAGLYLSQSLERNIMYIPRWFEEMVMRGEYGVKTGKGFYRYKEDPDKLYLKRIKKLSEVLRWLKDQRL